MVKAEIVSDQIRSDEPVELALERYRVELTGFCYRMLGSAAEAEDAVQRR